MSSSVIENDSIIVYNDIINKIYKNLLNGNKVLIVKSDNSVNKDAYKLLSNLNEYIYEIQCDSIEINDIIEALSNKENKNINKDKSVIKKSSVIHREIEVKVNKILKIYNTFVNKNNQCESLVDLYSLTDKPLNTQDYKYIYNSFYECNKEFMIKNKDYISKSIRDDCNNTVIKNFIKYKKFSSNHLFSIIKKDVDIEEINNALVKLKGLLNNTFALSPPIFINEYTEDFIQEDFNIDCIEQEEIYEVAKKVYSKYSDKIEIERINLLWYKPSSWISYFLKNKKGKLYKDQEIKGQLEIFNEYKENIDNLRLFKNSFYFLSEVITKEHLNKISSYLIREDELWAYLNKLERVLNIYKEYRAIKTSIESLNDIVLDLLEYCYKKYKSYEELVDVLKFIPTFYRYQSIKYIESKSKSTLKDYSKILQYIDELWITLQYEIDLLIPAIELSINNKVNLVSINQLHPDLLKSKTMNFPYEIEKNIDDYIELFFCNYPIIIVEENYSQEFIDKYGEIFNFIYYENELSNIYLKEFNEKQKRVSYGKEIDYPLRSQVIKLILSLGYKVTKNYKLNGKKLDIVISDQKNDQDIIVLYFDDMQSFELSDINYLLWLRSLKVKTFIIWSKDWWEDKNGSISKIKHFLNHYFH